MLCAPIANAIKAARPVSSCDAATPTANPSGALCAANARLTSHAVIALATSPNLAGDAGASTSSASDNNRVASSMPWSACRSSDTAAAPPKKLSKATYGPPAAAPFVAHAGKAISNSASASMTPAANPRAPASTQRGALRGRHVTTAPPNDVAPPAATDQPSAASTRAADAGSCAAQSKVTRKPSNAAADETQQNATPSASACSNASGSISPTTTDTMQPAANPSVSGWSGA
mmetsp:Transcript_2830/g.8396  ORF Transcript_2830/g.8396 Transcript_2830/m.8396 type:complete len:232 (-) Transcript_2830:150-845(-)